MKRMYLYGMFILLAGCASRKSSVSVNHRAIEQEQTMLNQGNGSRRQEVATQMTSIDFLGAIRDALDSQSSESMRIDLTVYDTDRTSDSATGKPPVLAEVIMQHERIVSATQERKTDTRLSGTSTSEQTVSQADSSQTEIKSLADRSEIIMADENRKTARTVPWWVWITALASIVVGWSFVKKRP